MQIEHRVTQRKQEIRKRNETERNEDFLIARPCYMSPTDDIICELFFIHEYLNQLKTFHNINKFW